MGKFRDFDAFRAEAEPLEIELFGEKQQLPSPADVSADKILHIQEIRASVQELALNAEMDPEAKLTDEAAEAIRKTLRFNIRDEASKLLGKELVDDWFAKGIDLATLQQIFWWAVDIYEGGDGEGNSQSPNRASRRAAKKTTKKTTKTTTKTS